MDIIQQNEKFVVCQEYIMGYRVRMILERATGDIYLLSEDHAKILGYANEQEMMSDDRILDLGNEIKEKTGHFPFVTLNFDSP